MCAVAASAAGVEAIDTVYTDIAGPRGLRRECREGVAMGFSGKISIHPGQIEAINAGVHALAGGGGRGGGPHRRVRGACGARRRRLRLEGPDDGHAAPDARPEDRGPGPPGRGDLSGARRQRGSWSARREGPDPGEGLAGPLRVVRLRKRDCPGPHFGRRATAALLLAVQGHVDRGLGASALRGAEHTAAPQDVVLAPPSIVATKLLPACALSTTAFPRRRLRAPDGRARSGVRGIAPALAGVRGVQISERGFAFWPSSIRRSPSE